MPRHPRRWMSRKSINKREFNKKLWWVEFFCRLGVFLIFSSLLFLWRELKRQKLFLFAFNFALLFNHQKQHWRQKFAVVFEASALCVVDSSRKLFSCKFESHRWKRKFGRKIPLYDCRWQMGIMTVAGTRRRSDDTVKGGNDKKTITTK